MLNRIQTNYKKAWKERDELLKALERPRKIVHSPYQLFFIDKFKGGCKTGESLSSLPRAISEHWTSLSQDKKAPYILQYSLIKSQYELDLLAWETRLKDDKENYRRLQQINEKIRYHSERMTHIEPSISRVFKRMSKTWSLLTADEKEKYVSEYNNLKNEYDLVMNLRQQKLEEHIIDEECSQHNREKLQSTQQS